MLLPLDLIEMVLHAAPSEELWTLPSEAMRIRSPSTNAVASAAAVKLGAEIDQLAPLSLLRNIPLPSVRARRNGFSRSTSSSIVTLTGLCDAVRAAPRTSTKGRPVSERFHVVP